MRQFTTIACFVAMMATPLTARADWLLTPYGGGALFDITDSSFRPAVGASLSWLGPVAGFEVELGDAPGFLETNTRQAIDQSNVFTLMGNAVIKFPTASPRVIPYAAGGVGLIQVNVTVPADTFEIDEQNFGFNAGGGVTVFFNNRLGLRGDFRYFQVVRNDDATAEVDALEFGELKFVRATIGVTFKF